MTSGIGQRLVITPYDPDWPRLFTEIRGMVQRTIPGTYHAVEHVGSTSVPGLAAKPIIDIDIVMREGQFGRIKQGLQSLGYEDEGDLGIPGRAAFYLRDEGLRQALAPHHLYVVPPDSPVLADHRDFKDFMLIHPEWVDRLNTLKWQLTARFPDDREAYQQAKSPMVEEILRLARAGDTAPPNPLSDFGEGERGVPTPSSRSGGEGRATPHVSAALGEREEGKTDLARTRTEAEGT